MLNYEKYIRDPFPDIRDESGDWSPASWMDVKSMQAEKLQVKQMEAQQQQAAAMLSSILK